MRLTEIITQLREERAALEKTTIEIQDALGITPTLSSQTGPQAVAEMPDFTHLECYKLCHSKLRSENELTNNRLSWNFTIQGFLFAAYALTLQTLGSLQVKYAEGLAGSAPPLERAYLYQAIETLHRFTKCLAWTGILVSILIAVGAAAAQWAIWSVQEHFYDEHPEHRDCNKNRRWSKRHGNHFPGVTGGGDLVAHFLGIAPLAIPLVFVGVWVVALQLALY